MTTRIGVVADSHCPEFMPALPEAALAALRAVDMILHAGDVNGATTVAELEKIAPVFAVRGDHDSALGTLPLSRELTVDGKSIVVVHGNRSRLIEEPQTLAWTLSLGHFHPHAGLPRALRRRFPRADVIVFGHTHRPYVEKVGGALLFNPGGLYQWTPATARRRLAERPGWFEWCWLQFARHLRSHPRQSVGILEIDGASVVPSVIEL